MKCFGGAMLLVLVPSVALAEGFWNPGVCSAEYAGGPIPAGGDLCAAAPTSDTAPADLTVRSAHCYAQGTQTPSNLVVAGGLDEKYITVDDFSIAAGDVVTVKLNGVANAKTEGVDFTCITSNDVCAAALATELSTISGVTALAVSAVVYLQPTDCGTFQLDTTAVDGAADGVFVTPTNGTDGQVLIGNSALGDPSFPAIGNALDPNTGIYWSGADTLAVTTAGTTRAFFNTNYLVMFAADIDMRSNFIFSTSGPLELGGNCTNGVSGEVCTAGKLYLGGSTYLTTALTFFTGPSITTAGGFMPWATSQTINGPLFTTGSTSNNFWVVEAADRNFDLQHPQSNDPEFGGHSANQSTTEYWSLTHNKTDAVFKSGAGNISLQPASGVVDFPAYLRHHDIPLTAAALGPTAPSLTTIGTFRCLTFAIAGETISLIVEVPSEWDGASDMALEIDLFTQSGDALANGEVIELDASYRSIAPTEAYDNGTLVTINPTFTGGAAETDKGFYHISTTIDYDDANQPLTVGDEIGLTLNRDVGASDTYSGNIYVCQAEMEYTAVRLGTH